MELWNYEIVEFWNCRLIDCSQPKLVKNHDTNTSQETFNPGMTCQLSSSHVMARQGTSLTTRHGSTRHITRNTSWLDKAHHSQHVMAPQGTSLTTRHGSTRHIIHNTSWLPKARQ